VILNRACIAEFIAYCKSGDIGSMLNVLRFSNNKINWRVETNNFSQMQIIGKQQE
jgi:hypothetical protein